MTACERLPIPAFPREKGGAPSPHLRGKERNDCVHRGREIMRDALAQQRARALRVRLTEAERHLWQRLRRKQLAGHRFRRQVPVGGYIADFVCLEAQLVIELDGGQHQQQSAYDERRDRAIAEQGFRVLRFWNDQVFRETDAVLSVILAALEEVK